MIYQTTTFFSKNNDVKLVLEGLHVMSSGDSWCSPHTPLLFPFWIPRRPVSCTTFSHTSFLFIASLFPSSLFALSFRGFSLYSSLLSFLSFLSDFTTFISAHSTLLVMLFIHTLTLAQYDSTAIALWTHSSLATTLLRRLIIFITLPVVPECTMTTYYVSDALYVNSDTLRYTHTHTHTQAHAHTHTHRCYHYHHYHCHHSICQVNIK